MPLILFIGGFNMKNKLKIIIRCIAFLLLFSMMFTNISDMLRRADDEINEIHGFYSEAENTIDVLYIGSSPVLRGISPMAMYHEYGFTGYARTSALQAPSVSYGLLAESLTYQEPELVVLLADSMFSSYDYKEREGDLRRGLDGMKISKYKYDIVTEIVKADSRQTVLSYFFPLFRYHERWKEIDWFKEMPNPLMEESFKKGHVYFKGGEPQSFPENFMEPTGIPAKIFDENAREYMEKSIALCKEKDIPILLIHLPKMSWSYEQSQAVELFSMEMGVDYLDMDREEVRSQLQLDPATEYYDQGHMNLIGSLKLSQYLGGYLQEQYGLPDHRGNLDYMAWEEDLKIYKEFTGLR